MPTTNPLDQLHLVWDDTRRAWLSPTNDAWETLPFRHLVARAVDCARPIIEDGAATDEELTDLLPIAQQALGLPGTVRMTDEQIDALARVAALGVEYMTNNGYADDPEYLEDAQVAAALAGMHEDSFTHALTLNFDRRWQD